VVSQPVDQAAIVQFLDATILWHQQSVVRSQMSTDPTDIFYANNSQPTADQVVHLSFEFARAGAQLLGNNSNAGSQASGSANARYQNLAQAMEKLDSESTQTQAQLQSLRKKLTSTPPSRRRAVESAIAETESELALLGEHRDLLQNMMQFIEQSAEPEGLTSQIDALERSVPGVAGANKQATEVGQTSAGTPIVVAPSARDLGSTSIWGTLRTLFGLTDKLQGLKQQERQTDELIASAKRLQAPMRATLTEMAAQSQTIANEADSQNLVALAQQKARLDGLTSRYKLLGNALLPLSKQLILLDVYQKNLASWYAAVKSDYSASLKSLLIRFLGLAAVLGVILGIFEAWRRTIVRYVPDLRRRYQFLLLRRIALWVVLSLVILFGLVSELGSLATFAGLMTAGVAVALQNVILAMVGYFLLIGKFGVQVGDRVQVSGVFGEVVEVGLVRLQIMELASSGMEAQPTGRVVAFSNAVVFQPNVGLFRQIPGASLIWHEITLTLTPDSDYQTVEQRIVAAVRTAFKDYERDFERLRRQMETNLSSVSIGALEPRVQLGLSSGGLAVLIRFPVAAGNASEIDGRVTRELVRAIEMEPKLKVVGTSVPAVRVTASAMANTSAS
jgi:small-conductance mechanosensitive channel